MAQVHVAPYEVHVAPCEGTPLADPNLASHDRGKRTGHAGKRVESQSVWPMASAFRQRLRDLTSLAIVSVDMYLRTRHALGDQRHEDLHLGVASFQPNALFTSGSEFVLNGMRLESSTNFGMSFVIGGSPSE